MATIQKHTETANVLVEAGADVNLQSNDVSSIGAFMLYYTRTIITAGKMIKKIFLWSSRNYWHQFFLRMS